MQWLIYLYINGKESGQWNSLKLNGIIISSLLIILRCVLKLVERCFDLIGSINYLEAFPSLYFYQ